jgi:hypothetical protein
MDGCLISDFSDRSGVEKGGLVEGRYQTKK